MTYAGLQVTIFQRRQAGALDALDAPLGRWREPAPAAWTAVA